MIVELRHYTMQPGRRDELIDLFDRELLDGQEAAGMRVFGQFRDLDDPNIFTFLRGFTDMPARAAALTEFYDGPMWLTHRNAANATLVDSDDVRLLRPTGSSGIFQRRSASAQAGLFVATIVTLCSSLASDFSNMFDDLMAPVLATHGGAPVATFETEQSANNFPRLPVREGERAFVWLTRFASPDEHGRHTAALESSRAWCDDIRPALARVCVSPILTWRLAPTTRSGLR